MESLTIRQQANRIKKWYDKASASQLADGLTWYSAANVLANTLAVRYDVTTSQAAQVIAVLSPQVSWAQNKRSAIALFNWHFNGELPEHGIYATKKTISECHAIMAGRWALPAKRLKTFSFADNIANTDSDAVTIDRHALRVAYDDTSASIKVVSPKQYREAARAYYIVAASLGIKAYQLQAIVWVTYKAEVNR